MGRLIIPYFNRISGVILVGLTAMVSLPLTIITIRTNGGAWGFGVFALAILVPLCWYGLFGVAGALKNQLQQWKVFLAAHVLTLASGIFFFLIFPLYPALLIIIPVLIAIAGLLSKQRLPYYLAFMIILGIISNAVLLKWELDFHRTVPLFQLF